MSCLITWLLLLACRPRLAVLIYSMIVFCFSFMSFIDVCRYVIAFSRQNDWISKRHCKAFNITVNKCLIPSVGIFRVDCKVKTVVHGLAVDQSYQEQFRQLTHLSGSIKLCLLWNPIAHCACYCSICPVFSYGSHRKFGRILKSIKLYVTAILRGRLTI